MDSSKSGSKPAGDAPRAPPPPRRTPRSSSKRGASFKASINRGTTLKNTIFEDAEADMNELNEESDSQSSSGGSILPPSRKMPLYKAGSYRKGKAGGPVPVRRLTKGGSTKATGSSFKGSLRNVAEDEEVGSDEDAEGGGSAEAPPLERRRTLPARRGRAGPANDSINSNGDSIRLFHSDTTASSCRYKESVNIMDFGVDHDRRPFTESMLSLNVSDKSPNCNYNESLSNFVDSQGFLGWNHHDDSSESTSLSGNFAGYRPTRKVQSNRRTSMDSSASSLTNLDSVGFLGWESQRQLVDSSKDLATPAEGEDDGGDDAGEEKDPASKEEYDDFNTSEKTWRIEDYENPNDNIVDSPKQSIPEKGFTKQIRRHSEGIMQGLAAKMNTWAVGDNDDDGDDIPAEIQTKDIKNILLNRSESESAPASGGSKEKEGNGRGWSLFQRRSVPDTAAEIDDYYARPAIRINREDGVDIGEMRRALRRESLPKGNKNKLNMGFF